PPPGASSTTRPTATPWPTRPASRRSCSRSGLFDAGQAGRAVPLEFLGPFLRQDLHLGGQPFAAPGVAWRRVGSRHAVGLETAPGGQQAGRIRVALHQGLERQVLYRKAGLDGRRFFAPIFHVLLHDIDWWE